MSAYPFCRECDGTGWIPYHSETLDGEIEEAYHLCPNSCTPRYCMGLRADYPCPRPGTVRYELGYYCKEHIKVILADLAVNKAYEEVTATFYSGVNDC